MVTADEIIEAMTELREWRETVRGWVDRPSSVPRGRIYPPRHLQTAWFARVDCDQCDCEEIERFIRQQISVVRGLQNYADFSQPFPEHETVATASGGRTEHYHEAPRCVQQIVDSLESLENTLLPALRLGLSVAWSNVTDDLSDARRLKRDIEIDRSRQFIEYLKALYWYCCGEEEYSGLLERLSEEE